MGMGLLEVCVMKISILLKPLSVNACFQGRRFKTPAYKQYDRNLDLMLMPFKKNIIKSEWYELRYTFYLKNYGMTDCDNCIKALADGLVRNGFLTDDRRIKRFTCEKFKADIDGIEVEILPYLMEN